MIPQKRKRVAAKEEKQRKQTGEEHVRKYNHKVKLVGGVKVKKGDIVAYVRKILLLIPFILTN
jgi:hypothetical protein